MKTDQSSQLPIIEVLDPLREAFSSHHELVLQAPPGAGKTTMVPLALLNEPWMAQQKILMLEPRRIAAQAAATRMSSMLGEKVGETVGYRIRLDNCVGEQTRIEVITEGILTRRLQTDPALEGVGLVIFDEFHERNLNSDLGLALTLHGRELFRDGPPLKILVMSATLDGEAVGELLGDAPILSSRGRQFPVTVSYEKPYSLRDSIIAPTVKAVLRALSERDGNILVFLPGQGEIRRVAQELAGSVTAATDGLVIIAPLYGGLSLSAQQEAIESPSEGVRKVVLATNIAETSLTIQGIDTVVDAGLVREPVYDPATAMTRLDTRRISRASAEQRMGRAGRLSEGHCYRLWSEDQHGQLAPFSTAEILQADLVPMTLQLLAWGVESPSELAWLDSPSPGPYGQAISMLQRCGAVVYSGEGYQLTPHGREMAHLPLHPRLAHMLLVGDDIGVRDTACLLAALLSERNPLSNASVDLARTLAVLKGETPCQAIHKGWFKRTWKQANRFRAQLKERSTQTECDIEPGEVLGVLLAHAYPDRVANLRSGSDNNQYQLANGRSAVLAPNDELAGESWLAVAEVGGRSGEIADRIYSATTLNSANFGGVLQPLVQQHDHVEWDDRAGKFICEQRRQVGKITLSKSALLDVPPDAHLGALVALLRKVGLKLLPWTKNLQQWRSRVMLLHGAEAEQLRDGDSTGAENKWPDLSDDTLLATLEEWLSPYLMSVKRLEDFNKLDLKVILHAQLPWPLPLELERLAPECLAVPSGSTIDIDYTQSPPVLQVKLQEMFGCENTPSIADGHIPLVVHLLSPARRPLQITQDLAGFWRSSYQDVKKEMKGRYPKHPWPDDPLGAEATRYTKRRMAQR